jgi:hypothetical protein
MRRDRPDVSSSDDDDPREGLLMPMTEEEFDEKYGNPNKIHYYHWWWRLSTTKDLIARRQEMQHRDNYLWMVPQRSEINMQLNPIYKRQHGKWTPDRELDPNYQWLQDAPNMLQCYAASSVASGSRYHTLKLLSHIWKRCSAETLRSDRYRNVAKRFVEGLERELGAVQEITDWFTGGTLTSVPEPNYPDTWDEWRNMIPVLTKTSFLAALPGRSVDDFAYEGVVGEWTYVTDGDKLFPMLDEALVALHDISVQMRIYFSAYKMCGERSCNFYNVLYRVGLTDGKVPVCDILLSLIRAFRHVDKLVQSA